MRKEESKLGLIQDLYISSLPLHVSLLPYLELCLRSLLGEAANLHAFLQELQIPCRDTKFSVSSSQIRDPFEWRTTSLSAILSRNLFRIDMWRMLIDVARFNHFALDLLRSGQITKRQRSRRRKNSKQLQNHEQSQQSIGAYLANEGYSNSFRDHYIIPLISVLWNVNNAKDALELPIVLLLRFMADCDLLRSSLFWSKWMCLTGGINEFEAAIANIAPAGRIHCNTTINSIKNSDRPGWLAVQGDEGHIEYFNHVIIATSAYDALNLISAGATDEEVRALDGFKTARTVAILHSDTTLMPKRKRVWATFNHITKSSQPNYLDTSQFCTSYSMNSLQGLSEETFGPVLITHNPVSPPHPLRVQGIWEYPRFMFNNRALKSHEILQQIQNTRGISYCGPWTRYGRYEDSVQSAFQVAVDHLGAELPFRFMGSNAFVSSSDAVNQLQVEILTKRERLARLLVRIVLVVYCFLGIVRRVVLYFHRTWERRIGEMKDKRGRE
ncbi:FAD dependent oxidoreductase [Histoplasma ohiense]|nr:FAD dependent oxidoreductase [Histoplasma ohiense (nom. inval.)]